MRRSKRLRRSILVLCGTALLLTAQLPDGASLGQIEAFAEKKPYTAEEGPLGSQGGEEDGVGPGAADEADSDGADGEQDGGGIGVYNAVDGNQIPEEALQDQVVEYRELGSLIHFNNSDVKTQTDSSERKRQEYTQIRDGLWTERKDAEAKKDEAKDNGNTAGYAEYASYEQVYKSAIKSYNSTIKRLDKASTNQGRRSLEKQLTSAAQSLMISYESLLLQKESLEQTEALYRQLYEEALAGQRAGTATDTDVKTAYSSLNSASISLSSLEDSENSIYRNLCQILGVDENGTMVLQEIPSIDMDLLGLMNLETDTQNAITNNSTIKSTRQTSSDGSSSGINKKNRTLEEQEEQLKIVMQNLYGQVTQAKQTYDAASVGFSSAQIVWENAQKSYHLGMMSKSQYIQSEIRYLQKKNSLSSAELSLTQAYETYQWAAKGIAALE